MKKTFTLLVISIFSITIWAQSPNKLSYQAVVRDANNNLVTEHSVGMQISILQGTETGTAVYTELQAPTTNANGLVSIEIGGGITSDDFSTIDWANGPYFIKTEIDPEGSTNYTITTVSQLLSVPYAKYADEAGNVFSGSYNDLADVPANMDTDATDDFDGAYSSLTGSPTNVSDFTNDAGYLTEVTGTETAFDGWDKDEDPWTVSSGKLIYTGGGKVGIGEANPTRALQINGGAESTYIVTQNDATGSTTSDGLLFGVMSNNSYAYLWNYENSDLLIGTNNDTKMVIDSDGNVGIGTSAPSAKLDVAGDVQFGTSGVVFSELREITGITSSTLHYVVVTLPTGYDEDNTRIISLQINYNSDRWSGLGNDNISSSNASTSYIINGTSLYIYYPDLSQFKGKNFRALIMKIE